ncbi:MAG: hypothetical protein DRJ03_16730 [Chloroflexi bacterium]|nr:MAG: hypothetical protein DRJ03_16730 [Chloroflexota bacterium]
MGEEKRSCFFCKHYYECGVHRAVEEVRDAIDEASNILNEYFVEDVFSKLNKIYDEVAKKCRDYEYQSPWESYNELVENIKELAEGVMSVMVPLVSIKAMKKALEKAEEKGNEETTQ